MTEVRQPMICARNLHPAEAEKLSRLNEKLTLTFHDAGYADVQLCEATGDGEQRKLTFCRGADRAALISLTAIAFLASNSAELCLMIETHLRKSRPA